MKNEIKEFIKENKEIEDKYNDRVNVFLEKSKSNMYDRNLAEGFHMEYFTKNQYKKLSLSVIDICDKTAVYIKELSDKNSIPTHIVNNYGNMKEAWVNWSNTFDKPPFNMVSELENDIQRGRAMISDDIPGILEDIRTLSAQDHISSILDIIKMPDSDKWMKITMPVIHLLHIEYVRILDYQRLLKFQQKANVSEEEAISIIHYLIRKNLTSFYFKTGKYPENTLLVKKVMNGFSKKHGIRPEDVLEVFQEYIGDGEESKRIMNHEITCVDVWDTFMM